MHSEERHLQLLRVAIESFARNGFSGTKTRDIAAAAGVSEAILFRHFATKEDLYHAILDSREDKHGAERRIAELQVFVDSRDDAGLFRHLGVQILRSFRDDAAFHRLMMYASLEGHLLANLFHERFVLPTGDFLRRYIALRQKEGAFRMSEPRVAVAFAIGTVVHLAMGRYVFGLRRPPMNDDAVIDELVTLVLGGLTAQGGSRPKNKKRKGSDAQS
jgi:TetR/AcrR family transcriptional regulator